MCARRECEIPAGRLIEIWTASNGERVSVRMCVCENDFTRARVAMLHVIQLQNARE